MPDSVWLISGMFAADRPVQQASFQLLAVPNIEFLLQSETLSKEGTQIDGSYS